MYLHAKNQRDSSIYSEIRVSCPFLTTNTQKLLKQFLTFLNLHQHTKNQLSSAIHSSIYLVTWVVKTISDRTHPNIFLSTPNFCYQYVKKQTISSPCSRDIIDLKSCNLIGQHHFGPIWLRNKLTDLAL